jgi:hypothetical protein
MVVQDLLADEKTRQVAKEFSKTLLFDLMADEQIIQQVGQLLVNAILTDTARQGFARLIQDTYLDPMLRHDFIN